MDKKTKRLTDVQLSRALSSVAAGEVSFDGGWRGRGGRDGAECLASSALEAGVLDDIYLRDPASRRWWALSDWFARWLGAHGIGAHVYLSQEHVGPLLRDLARDGWA